MENLIQEIENSVKALKNGKVILYPTDTIWGIGADATNTKAVQRIYKIKNREKGKSMIILLDDMEKLSDYVEYVPEISYDLIEKTRVPLTIVYPKAKNLAKNLIAADGSIAIRVVKGEYCSEVIRQFGKPIVSTSANISGDDPPRTFNDISQQVIEKVDYVVNIFRDRINTVKPSTIIKMGNDGMFEIIRS
jgi:L-threonylcarbamoyladenylate synthase